METHREEGRPNTLSVKTSATRSIRRPGAVIGALLLTLSCTDESPVAPPPPSADELLEVSAALTGSSPGRAISSPLAVSDLLEDPLFRSMARDIPDPSLASLLDEAIQDLEADRVPRAKVVLARASATADALMDSADADLDVLIHWSVIERYLDVAELI